MQAVADHKKKFMDLYIGYPGSVHDARVFQESSLFRNLGVFCGGTYFFLDLSNPRELLLLVSDGEFLLADSAYPCLRNMIVPYKDNGHLTRAQRKFNKKLSSCRVVIEHAFGDVKQRFRQLYHLKLRNIVRIVQIIQACCVLHNLANANDLRLFDPPEKDDALDPKALNAEMCEDDFEITDSRSGQDLRDELCRQFAI